MPRHAFDPDALLQRDSDSATARGKAFGAAWDALKSRRRGRARTASRRHAFDEADHGGALKQIEYARNHISAVQGGNSEFDPERFGSYFRAAMDCIQGGGEDELTEGERNRQAEEARDGVGETPARSVTSLKGERNEVDHRDDFNSIAQGGADSALADFDADALFQRY